MTSATSAAGSLADDAQPVLVAEQAGAVVGFARVIRSSDRCANPGIGEYTIYLRRDARGHGIGGQLLDALIAVAQVGGYRKLIGKLLTTNTASIAFARRCGFREVGVHQRHGHIDGEWKDLLIVERLLGDTAGA